MCQSHSSGQADRGVNQSVGPLESIPEAPTAGLPPASQLLPGHIGARRANNLLRHIWGPAAADANSPYRIRRGAGLSFPANRRGHIDARTPRATGAGWQLFAWLLALGNRQCVQQERTGNLPPCPTRTLVWRACWGSHPGTLHARC